MLNFNIKKKNFIECLSLTQGISEKKGSMPIISNVLIESEGNNLIKISATDLEISIIAYCNAEIISEGKTTVNSKKFFNIIKEFFEDGQNLSINFAENENGIAVINYKKSIFKLTTVPVIDFPNILDFKSDDSFNIEFKVLKNLISRVIFSTAASEDTKRNLTGVYFVLTEAEDKDYLRLVATDGHRLSIAQNEINYKGGKGGGIYDLLKTGIIIPKKVLSEIIKLDKDVIIKIKINSNNVIFEFENKTENSDKNTKFISRLIEGKFPDYNTVLPKDGYKISIISTKKLYNSIKMVSLLAEEKSHSIELSFSENNLAIKTVNTNVGEGNDELEINYKGEPISIKLNSRYILDFISNINEENLKVRFNTIYTPLVIEPYIASEKTTKEDENKENFIQNLIGVFMPMRY